MFKLDLIKNDRSNDYVEKAEISDFAIILGCQFRQEKDQDNIKNYGNFITREINNFGSIYGYNYAGRKMTFQPYDKSIGIRPSLILPEEFKKEILKNEKGRFIEFRKGYFPQDAPQRTINNCLEAYFKKSRLKRTGNGFTIDGKIGALYESYFTEIMPLKLDEYIFEGKRYIRLLANLYNEFESDNIIIDLNRYASSKSNEPIWVEVKPVIWIYDREKDECYSKKILFGGMRPFNIPLELEDRSEIKKYTKWEKSPLLSFMNDYIAKEMFTYRPVQEKTIEEAMAVKHKNTSLINYLNKEEQDKIIRTLLQSEIPIILFSNINSKQISRYVRELDNDAEIICLGIINEESLIGKSTFCEETEEMIDIKPSWLVNIERKCANEPDKIHLIYFDEIMDASEEIKNEVLNIIERNQVDGKWDIPLNARIIVNGREINKDKINKDNKIFENLVPIFLQDINLKDGKEKEIKNIIISQKQVNPIIYDYIKYKEQLGEDLLKKTTRDEEPEITFKKLIMASKLMSISNNPRILKFLLGEGISEDFENFCKGKSINFEDSKNEGYIK